MSLKLRLSNEIRVSRQNEWITRGVPFPQGELKSDEYLRIFDENGKELPLATEILARWEDGSIKWVLLQFPVSFETNGKKYYKLEWKGQPRGLLGGKISLQETVQGWDVDTGIVELTGDVKYIKGGLRDLKENMVSLLPTEGINTPMRTRYGWEVIKATGDGISLFWRDNLRFMFYADKTGLLEDF